MNLMDIRNGQWSAIQKVMGKHTIIDNHKTMLGKHTYHSIYGHVKIKHETAENMYKYGMRRNARQYRSKIASLAKFFRRTNIAAKSYHLQNFSGVQTSQQNRITCKIFPAYKHRSKIASKYNVYAHVMSCVKLTLSWS
jgi:hypothetical protein